MKLSALPTESTFALSDFLVKIKAAGAGDSKVTLQDFLTAIGMSYQEIGRTTLTLAGDTITVSSLPARKYLRLLIALQPTGGTINGLIRFNADTGNNYAARTSTNGAADSNTVSTSGGWMDPGTINAPLYGMVEIINISAQEKIAVVHGNSAGTAGAGNAPNRMEQTFKWANTAGQISSVSLVNSAGAGDFAIGSEVIVLGHD